MEVFNNGHDDPEKLIKIFKRKTLQAGIVAEFKERARFRSNSEKRRLKEVEIRSKIKKNKSKAEGKDYYLLK